MSAAAGGGCEAAVRKGQGDPGAGDQRAARALPRHRVRRHPRPVPGPAGAVPHRRQQPRHQLPVHGRLRGQGLPQCGDSDAAGRTQGALPGPHHHPAGQPREPPDHTSLRLLRRVPAQVRQRGRVEVLHRPV